MARNVAWSEPAWEDVAAAAGYIARDSRRYAAAFVEEIKNAAASLAQLAERGRVVPEFGDSAIRELLVGSYRLVYKITPQEVIIPGADPWRGVIVASKSHAC